MVIILSILIAITFFAIGVDYERGRHFKNKISFIPKIGDRYTKNDEFGDTEIEVINVNSKNVQYVYTRIDGIDITIEKTKLVISIEDINKYYYKNN